MSVRGVEGQSGRAKVENVTDMLLQLLDTIPEGCLTAKRTCKSRKYTRQDGTNLIQILLR